MKIHGFKYFLAFGIVFCGFTSFAEEIKIFDGTPKTLYLGSNSHGGWRNSAFQDRINKFKPNHNLTFEKIGMYVRGQNNCGDVNFGFDNSSTNVVLMLVQLEDFRRQTEEKKFLGPEDPNVTKAADCLEKDVEKMISKGADVVMLYSVHYHEVYYNSGLDKPESDKWPFLELAERGGKHRFIDMLTPTKEIYPFHLTRDYYHPSDVGNEAYAHYLFKTLLEYDGLEVPEWSKEQLDAAVFEEQKDAQLLKLTYPVNGEKFVQGGTMQIKWEADCEFVPEVELRLYGDKFTRHAKIDTVACNDPQWGNYEWVIPDSVVYHNKLVSTVWQFWQPWIINMEGPEETLAPHNVEILPKGSTSIFSQANKTRFQVVPFSENGSIPYKGRHLLNGKSLPANKTNVK